MMSGRRGVVSGLTSVLVRSYLLAGVVGSPFGLGPVGAVARPLATHDAAGARARGGIRGTGGADAESAGPRRWLLGSEVRNGARRRTEAGDDGSAERLKMVHGGQPPLPPSSPPNKKKQ